MSRSARDGARRKRVRLSRKRGAAILFGALGPLMAMMFIALVLLGRNESIAAALTLATAVFYAATITRSYLSLFRSSAR